MSVTFRHPDGAVRPLALDICCGLGGWSEGLLAEGWQVVGIDIEEHVYGEDRYPAGLIIQDALTVDGRAFAEAALIVASPPCRFFSYTAMPWSRAKALAAKVRADPVLLDKELALFRACFRIQREASEAAGRHIPLIVENVRGAIPWVGRSRWNFGSFHLWGDVPALMPRAISSTKVAMPPREDSFTIGFQQTAKLRMETEGRKLAGFRFDGSGRSFQSASVESAGLKLKDADGYHRDHPAAFGWKAPRTSSGGAKRKAASAMIAKIPFALSTWIARCFLSRASEAA